MSRCQTWYDLEMKTPDYPSKIATAKVTNPLPVPETCPHCGGSVSWVDNRVIYGQSYGDWPYAYICADCRSYVGLHPFTNIPLGTLATAAIRKARSLNKPYFEALFKTGKMDRSTAYTKLAEKLSIPVEGCHFGWFDEERCHKAAVAAREIFLEFDSKKSCRKIQH